MNKTCETCVYYDQPRCHFNPPTVVVDPNRYSHEPSFAVWPEVYVTDWCGQWKGDPWRGEGDPNYIGEVHATLP